MMQQSGQLVAKSKLSEEKKEIVGELYAEEISQNTKEAQLAVPIPDCLKEACMIPRTEIE